MRKITLYALPVLIFAAIVAFAAMTLRQGDTADPRQARAVPDFSIEGLSSSDLPDQAIVNIFASWCIPCEAEHPFLMGLSKEIPVYGIAFMDQRAKTDAFVKRLGNPFKKLGYDETGAASASWGVKGVPTTFLIRNGVVARVFNGPLTAEDAQELMKTGEAP